MGKIFSVTGQKGGPGKSSLAQSLAVKLHLDGHRVMLVDADPQKTTYYWSQDRKEEQPESAHFNCVAMEGNIAKELLAFKSDYDWVVLDTSGADSQAMRSGAIVADHLLIPLRPKRRDLKTLPHMRDVVLDEILPVAPNLDVRMIITQCPTLPSQAGRILAAKDTARGFGFNVMDSITYNRNAWDDAEEDGSSVLEFTDPKAIAEVRNICGEFGV